MGAGGLGAAGGAEGQEDLDPMLKMFQGMLNNVGQEGDTN